jgi:hypothetical protein
MPVRTTLNIDDSLLREAKANAARKGRTLTAVVEDALRESLARMGSAPPRESVELPTFRGEGGLMPGVDLDDNAAVRALLDEGVPLEQRR